MVPVPGNSFPSKAEISEAPHMPCAITPWKRLSRVNSGSRCAGLVLPETAAKASKSSQCASGLAKSPAQSLANRSVCSFLPPGNRLAANAAASPSASAQGRFEVSDGPHQAANGWRPIAGLRRTGHAEPTAARGLRPTARGAVPLSRPGHPGVANCAAKNFPKGRQ